MVIGYFHCESRTSARPNRAWKRTGGLTIEMTTGHAGCWAPVNGEATLGVICLPSNYFIHSSLLTPTTKPTTSLFC